MHKFLMAGALGLTLAACGGGSDGGSLPPPPPPQAVFDLVFDSEAADGSRNLQRVALDGSAARTVPNAINAVRPHARADGRALVFTSFNSSPLVAGRQLPFVTTN